MARRNANGLPGNNVMGRRSNVDGKGKGGRWLARQGKNSWVPGNTQYAGFAASHNAYGGRIKDGLVSLWLFGEGTGYKLNDVTPLTYDQDLTWAPFGNVNMTWAHSSTYGRWYGAFDPSANGAGQDLEPTDNCFQPQKIWV